MIKEDKTCSVCKTSQSTKPYYNENGDVVAYIHEGSCLELFENIISKQGDDVDLTESTTEMICEGYTIL